MRTSRLFLLPILLFLCGCDYFEYHPYDGRIQGETGINAKNMALIEQACEQKDTLRFVLIGDTQRCYDETEEFVKLINKRNDIDFVIHGGDISDYGMTKEYIWMRDIMNRLTMPYVVLLGNHDCLGNGKKVFHEIFGEVNFSFMAGNIKFVCLNTNAIEYDYSVPVPDFMFLENELAEQRPGYERTIFAMHARPYDEQFNNNIAKVFQRYINEFPQPLFSLCAHGHHLEIEDLFDDGMIYFRCANIGKRNYIIFTVTPDNYTYEALYF